MECRFCYARNPCNHCLHLEFYELQNPNGTRSILDTPKRSVKSLKSAIPFISITDFREYFTAQEVKGVFNLEKIAQSASSCKFCSIIHQAAKLFLSRSLKQIGYELKDTLYLQRVDNTLDGLTKSGPRLQFFTSGSMRSVNSHS